MYKAWRRELSLDEEEIRAGLLVLFPTLSAEEAKEIVLYVNILRSRVRSPRTSFSKNKFCETSVGNSQLKDLPTVASFRERRKKDRDVLLRERQKWFTARGRFQRIFNRDPILSRPLEPTVLLAESRATLGVTSTVLWEHMLSLTHKYRKQYYQLFTSKVQCCGPYEFDILFPYAEASEFSICTNTVDFLFAQEKHRKQWTLDHTIEAHKVIDHLKRRLQCSRMAHSGPKEKIDLGFYAHLLFVSPVLFQVCCSVADVVLVRALSLITNMDTPTYVHAVRTVMK